MTITLPDAIYQDLAEVVRSMKMGNYSPERWVSDLVISEMAARRRNEQRAEEPRLRAAARLVLAEHQSLTNNAPREMLRRLEAIAGELRRISEPAPNG